MPGLADQRLKLDSRAGGGSPASISVFTGNGNTIGVVGLDRPRMVLALTNQLAGTMLPKLRPRGGEETRRPDNRGVVPSPVPETA